MALMFATKITLKMSFGSDTVRIQSSDPHLDCTVAYSIGYSGSSPWLEGALHLPDKICGQKLDARVHIHSSFEKLDFHTGGTWGAKETLKREMKDGIDHCGTCPCDDCHYDCSWPGSNLEKVTSLGGPQHRRRRGGPSPVPASCTCAKESGLDTVTRRRQFQKAARW